MDKAFQRAEQDNASRLAQQIEQAIPGARVNDMGWLVLVMLENKSVFQLTPLTANTVDVSGKDLADNEYEYLGISWRQCLEFLAKVNAITPATSEETSTAAVAGFNTPGAFARPGQKSNRGVEQSEREGWQRIGEEKERDQSGRKKASDHPFGEDPLGRHAMNDNPDKKKNSEGRRKTETGHNWEGGSPLALNEDSGSNSTGSLAENSTPETLAYLAEMLPVDAAEIEGNKLTLTITSATIIVTAQATGNFSVQSFVDGELVQQNENIPAGDLVRWLFNISDQIQKRAAERELSSQAIHSPDTDLQVQPSEAYQVLKELARETGAYGGDDIIRNKSLTDLRQGLVVSKSPFSGRRFFGSDFNSGHAADYEVSGSHVLSSLRGSTVKDGHPVSINENRDMSRPFADTLGRKKLVWVPGQGCILINTADMPHKKKLNWDPEHGVILTDEDQPTNKTEMWRFRGWNS
jgi:hypothetical protein